MRFSLRAPTPWVGVDLGSTRTRIIHPERGLILDQPTAIAFVDGHEGRRTVGVGDQARTLIGKAQPSTRIVQPIQGGVVSDHQALERFLSHGFRQVVPDGGPFTRLHCVMSVPPDLSEGERRALIESTRAAGAHHVELIENVLAAGLGNDLDLAAPHGQLVVHIGGGRIDVAMISLAGLVVHRAIRVAGRQMDAAISQWLRRVHSLMISEGAAERIKIDVGAAAPHPHVRMVRIRGRDMSTGAPRAFDFSSRHCADAVQDQVTRITSTVLEVLQETPPELSADALQQGVLLTGGLAQLPDLDHVLKQATGIPFFVAEQPALAPARGLRRLLRSPALYERFMER